MSCLRATKNSAALKEGKTILIEKKILYAGAYTWADAELEQHVMIDILASSNDLVWISPYGSVRGPLLPRIFRVKEGFTVYHPGVNMLPLQFAENFNQKRRLMQALMFLMQSDFEPDLVWVDDPVSWRFAAHFSKKSVPVLYYCAGNDRLSKVERDKMAEHFDLIIAGSEQAYNRYEFSGKAELVAGQNLPVPEEGLDNIDDAHEEELREALLADINSRLEQIGRLAVKFLPQEEF